MTRKIDEKLAEKIFLEAHAEGGRLISELMNETPVHFLEKIFAKLLTQYTLNRLVSAFTPDEERAKIHDAAERHYKWIEKNAVRIMAKRGGVDGEADFKEWYAGRKGAKSGPVI